MEKEKYAQPDDKTVVLTLRSAVVRKSVKHPRGGYRSFIRLWGRIKLVAFYRVRAGFIRVLPGRNLSRDDSGLAVGGFGRRHHCYEPRRLLSGGSPHLIKFPEGLCPCGAGCARFSVSAVLAVGAFKRKVATEHELSYLQCSVTAFDVLKPN
jgi:hypothetical protein